MRFVKIFIVWVFTYILFVSMTQGLCNFTQYWQPFAAAAQNAVKYHNYKLAVDQLVILVTLLFLTLVGFFIANLPFHLFKIERRNFAFLFFALALICALLTTFLSYATWLDLSGQSYNFNLIECRNYLKYIPKFK